MTRTGSRMPLPESFIGMVVHDGRRKPDISTLEALRKALLAAKSIAYSDSSSGTDLSTVGFKKLGVADEIAGRTRKVRGPPSASRWRRSSREARAEIGFQQVAELIHVPGNDFVGTVPAELSRRPFSSACCRRAHNTRRGVALLRFLSSAEAAAVITKAGLKALAAR